MEPRIGVFGSANISDLSELGMQLEFANSRFYLKGVATTPDGNKMIVNFLSVIDRHYENMTKFLVDYTMTESEMQMYRYSPKRFCLDKFETMELWALLLQVNNMTSVSQFNRAQIKSFDPSIIKFIEEILIAEEDVLMKNRIETYE